MAGQPQPTPVKRPTQEDLCAVEVQVARAETRNAIHITGTCLACMRGLIKAPYWSRTEQNQWDNYKRNIQEALVLFPTYPKS